MSWLKNYFKYIKIYKKERKVNAWAVNRAAKSRRRGNAAQAAVYVQFGLAVWRAFCFGGGESLTVASDSNKCLYVGNGVTRVWPYSFLLYNAAHLEVWVKRGEADSVRLERGYVLNELERTVTYPVDGTGEAPLSDKDRIILMRVVPVLQLLDLVNQGNFFSEDIEQNFDLLVMMIQQVSEALSRAVVGPVDQTDSGVAYQTLLEAVEEAKRIRDETAALVEGISQEYADALAAALARLDTWLAAALAELKVKGDADAAAARAAAEAAGREADRAFAQAGAAEDWADASCTCAKTAGELGREFVAVMQSYKGLYTEISVVDGGDAMAFAGILLINDGSDTAGWGSVSEVRDGQTSHAGSWYVIDPLVLQALNPKGIKDVSEINENGEITITIDNTM